MWCSSMDVATADMGRTACSEQGPLGEYYAEMDAELRGTKLWRLLTCELFDLSGNPEHPLP